jgi:hypothetical protein
MPKGIVYLEIGASMICHVPVDIEDAIRLPK